jgi:poly(A) polymerase
MKIDEVLKLVSEIADIYMLDKPYIVGGLPRDTYLKKDDIKTSDIDLTTNSPDVLRLGILLAEEINVTFDLSDDGHLTVFSDRFDLDFSSHFISDAVVEYLDGSYKGLEEAFSRDFTINTLHQDLVTRKIIDPTEMGFEDIRRKIIRTPVPPEITLTDDPRRVYRAINLAARYGYDIDEDIKIFVREEPELFGIENIKDKYISVKIIKALEEDPGITIKLLRELNLFRNVPLTGYFKDFLIENKMLANYLGGHNE